MFSPEDPNSDVLQPLALEEWPYLQGELKIEWPKYAHVSILVVSKLLQIIALMT